MESTGGKSKLDPKHDPMTDIDSTCTDREAVRLLLQQQKQQCSIDEWLTEYRAKLKAVKDLRLKSLTESFVKDIVKDNDVKSKSVRLRMNLEPKHDGRKKGEAHTSGF